MSIKGTLSTLSCYADGLKRVVQMQIAVTLGIFNLKFKYVGPI